MAQQELVFNQHIKALSCFAKSVYLFWGAPKMCSPQNDVPFFVSYIAILGVLFMRDLAIYFLFMIIMLCSILVLLQLDVFHPSSYSSSERTTRVDVTSTDVTMEIF